MILLYVTLQTGELARGYESSRWYKNELSKVTPWVHLFASQKATHGNPMQPPCKEMIKNQYKKYR